MKLLFQLVSIAMVLQCLLGSAHASSDEPEQVCVTLDHHGDDCHGSVRSSNTFTALTGKGSPCKHTSKMKNNSAKDQYCELDKGIFHQTVYVGNKHCKVGWQQKAFSPKKLTYTAHKCTYGYKLRSCVPGPCEKGMESDEALDVTLQSARLLRGTE